ncbi:hypothetical protein RRG08_053327 [Elysia crispata]|uniref:Uncharacterized protein n=1 Tax=Elysia crispata TaxID=231223 RepID=A0AAE1DIM2_9GAST|nr:hypothetical protein RRG08_053327 [Elysia crispata]
MSTLNPKLRMHQVKTMIEDNARSPECDRDPACPTSLKCFKSRNHQISVSASGRVEDLRLFSFLITVSTAKVYKGVSKGGQGYIRSIPWLVTGSLNSGDWSIAVTVAPVNKVLTLQHGQRKGVEPAVWRQWSLAKLTTQREGEGKEQINEMPGPGALLARSGFSGQLSVVEVWKLEGGTGDLVIRG